MDPLFAAHISVFAFAALLCFASIPRARRITHHDTKVGFVAILVTCGLWSVGYIGYFLVSNPPIQEALYIAGIVSALACVGAWLYFSLAYTGRAPRNVPYRRSIVGVFVFIALLKVTNPLHGWYFTTELVSEPFVHLALHHGVLHWVILGFSYVVIGISFFLLLERFFYAGADSRPLIALLLITAIPIGFNILGVTGEYVLPIWYEPIGVAIFAVGTLFVYSRRFEAIQFAGGAEEAAVFLDQDGSIRDFNQAAAELFPNLTGSIGKQLAEVSPEFEDLTLEDETVITRDTTSGERFYRVSTTSLTPGDAVTGRLVTILDITESEVYRRELEMKSEQLEALNRVIRHDIRNDMTVILGWAQILPDHVDDEGEELLDHIIHKSEHVIELTNIAREFIETLSDESELELRPINIDRLLELEVDAARESFPEARIEIEDEIPQVKIQGNEMIGSVFRNLLNNAIQHNDEDVPEIEISTDLANDSLRVNIADNGPGIPDEQKTKIFGKGEKGLDSDGTGIGLYLVDTLIDQVGGEIWIEDNEPKGAIFIAEFPVVVQPNGE